MLIKRKKANEIEVESAKVKSYINQVNEQIELLGQNTDILYEALEKLHCSLDRIRNKPSDKMAEIERIQSIRYNWSEQAENLSKYFDERIEKGVIVEVAGAGLPVMLPLVARGIITSYGIGALGCGFAVEKFIQGKNSLKKIALDAAIANGAYFAGNMGMAMLLPVRGIMLVVNGIWVYRTIDEKKRIERIMKAIAERDISNYKLAIADIQERIKQIKAEADSLEKKNNEVSEFGDDYEKMTENQQYILGECVNIMNASTMLLIDPIEGLRPKYSDADYDSYVSYLNEKFRPVLSEVNRNVVVVLANFLFRISLDEEDKKILYKVLKKNKELRQTMNIEEWELKIKTNILNEVLEALEYKYNAISNIQKN